QRARRLGGRPGGGGPRETARRVVRQLPRGRRGMSQSLTEQLMPEQPSLHGEAQLWGLAWAALAYIERTVQPGMATLETGAGASTMVFAARGAEHEAVTPSADEAERIARECERRGISTERLTFRIGSSADVL